jgi:hypothetical protein
VYVSDSSALTNVPYKLFIQLGILNIKFEQWDFPMQMVNDLERRHETEQPHINNYYAYV